MFQEEQGRRVDSQYLELVKVPTEEDPKDIPRDSEGSVVEVGVAT
jgi:hypothetical protein